MNTTLPHLPYAFAVIIRCFIAFVVGYFCANYCALLLTHLMMHQVENAEAVYLASLISIILFVAFVIFSFIIQSLKKLTIGSIVLLGLMFSLSTFLG